MPKERDEKGRYTEGVPLETIRTFVLSSDDYVNTRTVANNFNLPWRTANHKLHQLDDDGDIEKIKMGQTALWGAASSFSVNSPRDDDVSGGFHRFRGIMESEKTADELLAEGREKDSNRENQLAETASKTSEGQQ
jgi:hypothetical protein